MGTLSEGGNVGSQRKCNHSIGNEMVRKSHVQSKEQSASLIAQINTKSVENLDLNAQLQEKVFAISALKNELRKLKGKNVVDNVVSKRSATIAPGMFKLDIEPISHRLKNNKDAHEVYLEKTIENTDTLRGLLECARKQNPSEPLLESACMFTKHVQELLVYVSKTCPSLTKPCEKLAAVTPMNKEKRLGVKPTTSARGSKPSGNTKINRITRPPSRYQKNKVEEHPKKVKSSLNKMNSIFEPISNAHVKHSVRNVKFESICVICRTLTIVGNKCPITRITSSKEVPLKEITITPVITQSLVLKEPKQSWGSNVSDVPSSSLIDYRLSKLFCGTVRFRNYHIAKIMGYGDYQMENVTISQVYYVERKPDLSYLRVFGALCYPTNNDEDLGKLKLKANIGIFVGYTLAKKAFQIYNKWTRLIIETIHVDFDELTAMASEQFSSGPGPKLLTPGTISSGLPMFDVYLNPSPCVDPQVPVVIAQDHVVSTSTPSSTIIDQDAPSTITSQTNQETPSPVIPLGVGEADHDIEVAHMDNNLYVDFLIPELSFEESSTQEEGIDFEESFAPVARLEAILSLLHSLLIEHGRLSNGCEDQIFEWHTV
ncbi:retrovirus-related pol polyprotein from transposon TNT 1-94 [Tanacetum coccineum]|uniref:Retrovirus-related pol polyprotein from transposon TNT 1-94 n=1 Tax=Tanacetum coccineum TaxID=301880 RepID=A0ABQ5EF98_9ASTR